MPFAVGKQKCSGFLLWGSLVLSVYSALSVEGIALTNGTRGEESKWHLLIPSPLECWKRIVMSAEKFPAKQSRGEPSS